PVQADKRRPWIDWIHTARDQGALVRGYTKWDDQPASVPAAMESIMRAWQIARTPPAGPTYICLDVGLQESELSEMPALLDPSKYPTPGTGTLLDKEARAIVERLAAAERPLILMGRMSRSEKGWADRVR